MAIKWADVAASDKYKTANPEKQIEIQDTFFNTFVKAAPGYDPKWEPKIKSKLFGIPEQRDRGALSALSYSVAEAITRIPQQLATGTEKLFPQEDIVTWRKERLEKRRASLTPEQISKEESNIKQVEDFLTLEKTQKDKLSKDIAYSKAKHPAMSFLGEAGGSVVPYMAAGATGLPLWASFGSLGVLEEASRQFATPEEKLTPLQRAAKVSVSGAAGAVTGRIFEAARIGETFLSRALRRSGGAGATTVAENIIDDFSSGKQPDVNKALVRGGLNAVTIGVFSFLTELPELRGLVWREAKAQVGKAKLSKGAKIGERYAEPKTYAEAKQIVRETTNASPEELSPQFKKAKQEIIKRGIRKDVKENIEYYKKKVGLNESELNDLLNVKSINQFDELARNYSAINPEFVKRILPFREQIASGLATPEEIVMAMELREMAKPQTAQSEVVKTGKPNLPIKKTQGQKLKEVAISDVRIAAEKAGKTVTPVIPETQPIPIEIPKELTEGEHLITPEQALDKTVADIDEVYYIQSDIFKTAISDPIESQVKALKEQLSGLKGQRGGETALVRKDITNKIEELRHQLEQANDAVQEQYMNWGMQLQDIIKTKAKEQGLDLPEEEMQNLADQVTMSMTETWGKERYWNTKVSDVIDDVIQEFKEQPAAEEKAVLKKVDLQGAVGSVRADLKEAGFDIDIVENAIQGGATHKQILDMVTGSVGKDKDLNVNTTVFSANLKAIIDAKESLKPTGVVNKEEEKLIAKAKNYTTVEDFIRGEGTTLNLGGNLYINSQAAEAYLRKIWKQSKLSTPTGEGKVESTQTEKDFLNQHQKDLIDAQDDTETLQNIIDGEQYNKAYRNYAAKRLKVVLAEQQAREVKLQTKADTNYKLVGYYDTAGYTEKDETETGNRMPGKKFKKDIVKFGNALKAELGWEWGMSGKKFTSPDVNNNHASMAIMKPGSDWGIYISIDAKEVNGDDLELGGSLGKGMAFLYRATKRSDPWGGESNNYAAGDITVGELAKLIIKTVEFHSEPLPEEKTISKETLTKEEKSAIHKSEEKKGVENVSDRTGTISESSDAISGGPGSTEQVPVGETERRQQSVQSEVKLQRSAQYNQESDQENRVANLGNYRITADDLIGQGSPKEKYQNNLRAIKTLKKIESENRKATPEEQSILIKYVGWGGLSKVFSYDAKGWEEDAKVELRDFLTEDEFTSARASTINAHYTSPEVISGMWQAVMNMGFERGKVLEPAMGIGHFLGLRPEAARIAFTGIELDDLTGRIAKQLYQNGDIQIKGFQDAQLSKNFYDLAISNVPFADVKPYDPKAKELGIPSGLNLHDYFFAKSLALVKPGGVVAFITSKGTMDKQDSRVREHLASQADLLGAIRLPNTAFKANAGTEVTTDIIFLRKRLPKETPSGEAWINSTETKISNRNVFVNEYFIKNTAMVLGNMKVGRGMYSENELTVEPNDKPLAESLKEAIGYLPKGVIKSQADIIEKQTPEEKISDETNANQGTFILKDGKVYQKQGDKLVAQVLSESDKLRLIGVIQIRDALKELYIKQEESENDSYFKQEQIRLNSLYDKFVKKYGALNNSENENLFSDDPSRARLLSLETENKRTKKFEKNSDIFTKRVIHHHKIPTHADNALESAYTSLSEYGHLNWNYMSEITGHPIEDLQKELSTQNIIYKNPEGETWEFKDAYLSGNVKLKLKLAEAAVKVDSSYTKNIEALKQVIPADKPFQEITARLGTTWIDAQDYKDFIKEILEISSYKIIVEHNVIDGYWNINLQSGTWSIANTEEWGTTRYPAIKLLEAISNNKQIKVFDKITEDGVEKSIVNEQETAVAQDKAEILTQKFSDWFWLDEERRTKYLKLYNDEFNAIVNRYYDGSHLTLPGMSPVYIPRKTQLNAIYRGIISRNLLLAHEVGAGKTLIMIAIIMESKRLGLINKPLVIVPRNTLSQWKRQFNTIYPAANILIADEQNFTKSKRQMFLGKASSGNWDAIIMADSSNSLIDVSDELYEDYINEQLDELRVEKERQQDAGSRITVKQIEKSILKKEEFLKQRLDRTEKDKTIVFEELGIDAIFVDEADRFKNLAYNTRMQGVKGLGAISGNDRTEDLMMKLRVIRKRGGKVVFATGTPISNSMAEVHVMMKYLQPDLLAEKKLTHFDSWAKTFGETSTDWEVDASNRYKAITRFSRFVNIQSLLTMLYETWDIQTASMLEESGILVKGIQLPFYKGGKPTAQILNPSQELKEYIQELGIRADKIKGVKAQKGGDNMLVILIDGIKASTDMRLIDPTLPGNPNSKIEYSINGIFERWEKTKLEASTQIVFIDRTAPDKDATFNPQWYMKRRLMEMGIPEREIAFIHDYKTMEEKDDLYEQVNNGKIRVLFGSTEKLGAGTNVQERLTTLWHIDTPYRPRDIMQREGRIMRPGHLPGHPSAKEIEVMRLATIGSFDTFLWQILEIKAKYISDVMSGKIKTDVMDESYDEYSIIKAATSESPLLKEKVGLDKEIRRLTNLKNAFLNEKFKAQHKIKELPKEIENLKKRLDAIKEDIKKRPEKLTKETFKVTIDGKEFKTKEDAWTAIKNAFNAIRAEDWNKEIPLGNYQGFDLTAHISQDVTNNTRVNRIMVKGIVNYEAVFSESAIGTFASIDNALYSWPEKVLENNEMRYQESNKHLIISKSITEKEFEYDKSLAEKSKRQIEVNRLLKAAAEGTQRKDGEDIIELHAGINIFGHVKQEIVNDNLNTGEPTFIDSEVERRFKEAHGQQHPNSLVNKIKQYMISLWESRKEFPYLPGTEYYAEAKFLLQLQNHAKSTARDKTIRNISDITHGFGSKKLNLFTRAVILADFMQEAEKGRPIPMGYSYYDEEGNVVINSELLKRDKENIDSLVNLNPDVKAALERRTIINKQITDDLVKYKILTLEQVKEDYYRHQVLEYANAKAVYGPGKKLKTPNPGYAKRRYGSVDKDINTNYLEAEFEFMSQAYHDIETAKNIEKFRVSKYNIKDSLKDEARQLNDKMLDRVTIEGQYNKNGDPATLRDLIKPFNSKMAFGFSNLEKLGYDFPVGEGSFEELARLAESDAVEPEAQMNARMILKAVSDRRKFIRKNLGKNYKEWRDVIPEGYTTWQPKEGRLFFNAYSIPQRIISEILSKAGEEIGVTQEDLNKLIAVGGLREEFVIPQELADSLNNLFTINVPNWINEAVKAATSTWKKWILFNPRRAFSYNFQNFLGDSDHVLAANPKIFMFFHRAASELGYMFYQGKSMSLEMREFFERGGIDTMLTIQEIPDINTLEIFLRMTKTAENAFSLEWAKIEIHKAWNTVIRFTMFRESILRYAAYLYYREVFLSGKKEYGGAKREDVEGLSNPLDKAAKVANDTLGDYSALSQFMKDARQTIIPFGSWLEINFKIYYNLNRNAIIEGGFGKGLETFAKTSIGAGIRITSAALLFYLTFVLRCILLTAIVALYNQLYHKDEESDLSPYDQNRMHIVLGRDKYGNVKIRRGQGAFSDLLEWIGLDQLNVLLRDYWDGKASLTDIFGKIPFVTGKVGLKPIYLKIMRGINPIYKALFETATNKYLPGLDERSGTIEDKARHILKSWSLENEYDWITKKPSRGYAKSWEQVFITTTNPEENAFRYIQGQKYAYRDRLGKGGSGDYYTPRSILYRQYKKALLYKDEGARVAALKEMMKLGVTVEDLDRSLTTNDPLYGLNEEQKIDFVRNYLTVRDREKLKDAYRYYLKTFVREKKR